jgi:transcriptional regulator with XRE-family HTH domain
MIKIDTTIKQQRLRLNMTQENLADYFNTTKTTISKWENGTLYPDITLLPKLAKLFNLSVDDLLNYDVTLNDTEIKNIMISLSELVNKVEYDEYLNTVNEYYLNNSNEFTLLTSLLGLLTNHIYYSQNHEQVKQTIDTAYRIIHLIEQNCDAMEVKKQAKCYKSMFLLFDGQYSEVIHNIPDYDIKLGECHFLAQAYIIQGEKEKAGSVLQADMYQSLMLFLQNLSLIFSKNLHSLEIEDLEHRIYHLNEAFNTNYLYPYTTIHFYYCLALHYAEKDTSKMIKYLETYCQCFDYLISDFNYWTDEFFNDIEEWFIKMPFGRRFPANYMNMMEILYSLVADNDIFNQFEDFKDIKSRMSQIYLKRKNL